MGTRRKTASDIILQRVQQQVFDKDDAYCEGSIVRIKLENVLTYDSVEFKTGPCLNVVIGPNGTGKSTIMCAICLGLGGKPSVLQRAQQSVEFIKYGCNTAKIEIELHNPDGDNYIIRHDIHKNGPPQWTVNGRSATKRSVEELVARLNIQVGNLCQFLPQEKVAEFSKMTPEDLLENTEKAVGPPDMYENHKKLQESRNEARRLQQGHLSLTERLEQLQQKNARLEQDVKNFEERAKYLQKIKILQMKRPWVEYDHWRKQYELVKGKRDKKADELRKEKTKYAPRQKQLDETRREKEMVDGQMKSKTDTLRDFARKAHANSQEIESFSDKLAEIQDELKYKQNEEATRQKKIHDLKGVLQSLQEELRNTEETEDVQPQIDKVRQEMNKLHREMSKIHYDGEAIGNDVAKERRLIDGYQQELKELQNIENRRLDILRLKHRHTYDAVQWFKSNKDKFHGEVHLPLMLSVNPKDPAYAKYIEMHISPNDMRSFVFEKTEDYNLFMDEIRERQKLKVNAIKVPPQPLSAFISRKPISAYTRYDFQQYLKDYIICSDGVMRYLCAQYHVHNIPVGTQRTKEMVEDIKRNCPELRTFYTNEYQYSCKVSKYDKSMSSRSTKIRDPTALTTSGDTVKEGQLTEAIRECRERLRAKEELYQELKQKLQQLETAMNRLREEKKKLMQMNDKKKRLESQIESKRQRIRSEESDAVNLQVEEEKVAKKIRDINLKKCKSLQQLKSNTQECLKLSMEKVRLSLKHATVVRNHESLEAELRDQSQVLQNFEREFEQIKEDVRRTKYHAKELLKIAKRATNTAEDAELSADMRQTFESIKASTLEEIDSIIHEQQARADTLFQTDESVVKEYKDRKKEIAQLHVEVENRKKTLDGHQAEIQQAKQHWLDPLKELIERINENFGYFFSCMKCAGEVDLNIPENPEDYEKYGVKIKVKFRDSEVLRELTPHHQSGGEKSVATILYMMSLQELARCPFRCVDEINQGMDPVNERKVFELVVQTVCKKSTSQYFLLTPKLLPDLEYADNMTVLCVYNGPQMLNHTEWNLRKFIKKRRKIRVD